MLRQALAAVASAIFDWVDSQIMLARYEKRWKRAIERFKAQHDEKMKEEPYWESRVDGLMRECQHYRKMIHHKNDLLEDLSFKLRVRRAMTRPADTAKQFNQLKQKRIEKLLTMVPGNYTIVMNKSEEPQDESKACSGRAGRENFQHHDRAYW